MTTNQVKEEIIKRYKYLYENAEFILAPFVKEHSKDKHSYVYLEIDEKFFQVIEEFLFSNDPLERTILYLLIEDLKTEKEHLENVKEGLSIVERYNQNNRHEIFNVYLRINRLFSEYLEYLEDQKGDTKNKENKFIVLDEYYRLLRYQNDGKMYQSGVYARWQDYPNASINSFERLHYDRSERDTGIEENDFIRAVVSSKHHKDNLSIFTEQEKSNVYHELHNEIPYETYKTCELEEEYIKTMIESRLQRPENTEPCNETFRIDEKEIFINPDDKLYRYYQLCPHCGYIVNIPKETLSDEVKQRIEERCSKDLYLFRKKCLQSELIALENKSNQMQLKK